LGRGKRVERVEDVVSLGDDIIVRVDDVDPQGKVALSPVGEDGAKGGGSDEPESAGWPDRPPRTDDRPPPDSYGREFVSFEEAFDSEAKSQFGDLGPAEVVTGGGGSGAGGGPRRNRDRDRRRSGRDR
ncbi:MAG: polyribonucleotide nucleotidyltransferase, partial [Actinomycetota bacterium]|nr:polyribonucleotide nucleotidyltransferase [Actinomycetota bacterium]